MTYISSFSRRYRSSHRTAPILPLLLIAITSLGFAYVHTTDFKHRHPATSTNTSAGSKVQQVTPLNDQQYQQNTPLETVTDSGSDAGSASASTSVSGSQSTAQQPTTNSTSSSNQQNTTPHTTLIKTLLNKLSL